LPFDRLKEFWSKISLNSIIHWMQIQPSISRITIYLLLHYQVCIKPND
jgi:hypothetical protein